MIHIHAVDLPLLWCQRLGRIPAVHTAVLGLSAAASNVATFDHCKQLYIIQYVLSIISLPEFACFCVASEKSFHPSHRYQGFAPHGSAKLVRLCERRGWNFGAEPAYLVISCDAIASLQGAWTTMTWFAILVSMSALLNKHGVVRHRRSKQEVQKSWTHVLRVA